MNIQQLLADLENLYDERTVLALNKQELINEVLTPEVKQKLNDIDEEWKDKEQAVSDNIKEMEEVIRNAVIEVGYSVKGEVISCLFVKASTKWNTDGLEGYALSHPEILIFRKIGSPSARIVKNQR